MLVFLVYHRITDDDHRDFRCIDPPTFRWHLEMIEAARIQGRIQVVDPGGPTLSADLASGVVLAFDDGTLDHFLCAGPILSEFGLPGLFYLPTARLDTDGHLSTQQVVCLHAEGHTIGSHSHTHARFDVLPEPGVERELETSRSRIQEILGDAPLHFAPPEGLYRPAVQTISEAVGFRFFRTMKWGFNRRLNTQEIQVVPIVTPWSNLFLRWALTGRNELTLKVAHGLKRTLRVAADAKLSRRPKADRGRV